MECRWRYGISVCALLLASIGAMDVACSSKPETTDASSDAASDAPIYMPQGASIKLGKPNGTVGPWQAVTPLPTPRANFCATVVGNTTFGWESKPSNGFRASEELT